MCSVGTGGSTYDSGKVVTLSEASNKLGKSIDVEPVTTKCYFAEGVKTSCVGGVEFGAADTVSYYYEKTDGIGHLDCPVGDVTLSSVCTGVTRDAHDVAMLE